jgi:thiol:disulfide interchange protein
MIDVPLRDFLSWPRDRRQSILLTWEWLKNIYLSENTAQLRTQQRIDTFFDIRVPPDRDDSDDSYSPSDMSDSSDSMSFASDLSGDTVLSLGVILSSDVSSVDYDMFDEESTSSEVSRIGWDTD